MNNKTIIAMSGGVDSSVAAFLMKESGAVLMGVTLNLTDMAESEADDAKKIAQSLGFFHTTLDLRAEFEKEVIDRFISAYERCTTPNPCIYCNQHIKFGYLLDYAKKEGYDSVATGHYVRAERSGDRYILKKGTDPQKDQSYVLYCLTQEQLSKSRFPLGALTKDEVRQIANSEGFVNAKKRESQDICFVPDGDYAAFIERKLNKSYKPGEFVDFNGNVLGTHKGLIRYTIGQRKGLGLSLPKPMYVCSLCPERNSVILGDNDDLFSKTLDVCDINLIATDKIDACIDAEVKIRYSQRAQKARVWQTAPDRLHIEFNEPQRAITSGQSAVLYDGDTVIGGGIIM